ncbi:MAG TPA: helix-turn-helix domain-containing protein [Solirubrobacterales bacterium]|jgi:AcrR family transcriptional regulator
MTTSATAASASTDGARTQRADARRNRRKVLDAARKAFAEDGLDVRIEKVARKAGVGVGTVYRHFPTKEDLLQALADDRFAGLAEAARRALDDPDAWSGFSEFMRYSAEVMAEDRALSEAMDQRPEMCGQAAEDVRLLEIVGELIQRAQADGALRADVVAEDVPSLICGLGRATRESEGRPSMSWERYLAIILAGLRPAAGSSLPRSPADS